MLNALSAFDIFTGASCEELCPSTHSIDVPVVNKTDWMIQGTQDETYVLLMNDDGEMREDLQLPSVMYKTDDDMKTTELIKNYCELVDNGSNIDIYCSVLSAVGQEKIIDVKKRCLNKLFIKSFICRKTIYITIIHFI